MAMVVIMDQQQQKQQPQPQTYKYYCRICNKGFGCGRALGGHMRAHGINDDPSGPDDDPSACGDWAPGDKRSYALRTNPNRFKSCRACESCGREFVSWKAFLDHGKCSSDDDCNDEYDDDELLASSDEDGLRHRSCAGWSKGKRLCRAKSAAVPVPVPVSLCPSSEEEDLANCLVMLSSARVDPMLVVEAEESCASASKDEDRRYHPATTAVRSKGPTQAPAVPKGMFECKACKKVFTSHQALGGHRASHKKVKGCFAAKLGDLDDAPPEENATGQEAEAAMAMAIVPFENAAIAVAPLRKKSKVHECSICHRQFASGQALGGHKRCHWITSNPLDQPSSTIGKLHQLPDPPNHRHDLTLRPMFDPSEPMDLNMPVGPVGGLAELRQEIGSPLRLEVPAAMYLQQWVDDHKDKATVTSSNNHHHNINNNIVDDEVDSKVKVAKLSELKDMNAGEEASPWLQVGIGSSGSEK